MKIKVQRVSGSIEAITLTEPLEVDRGPGLNILRTSTGMHHFFTEDGKYDGWARKMENKATDARSFLNQADEALALAAQIESDREVEWSIVDYCREEVRRQGHDITKPAGIIRVAGMLQAWEHALEYSVVGKPPYDTDVRYIAKLIEPQKNADGYRKCRVRVGDTEVNPKWMQLYTDMLTLLSEWNTLEPLDFYRKFCELHPFVDGNGRTGKVLLNWRAGTLSNPFFPPNDFWGKPILNP